LEFIRPDVAYGRVRRGDEKELSKAFLRNIPLLGATLAASSSVL
jgi:hypothetical protein